MIYFIIYMTYKYISVELLKTQFFAEGNFFQQIHCPELVALSFSI